MTAVFKGPLQADYMLFVIGVRLLELVQYLNFLLSSLVPNRS